MAYRIKRLPYEKRTWKVQYATYANAGRKDVDIALSDYQQHGFLPSMTYEEAVARKDQLNALEEEKRHQSARVAIAKRLGAEEQTLLAYLNELDVRDFEKEVLFGREGHDPKTESHWRCCKRMLCALKLEPKEWWNHRTKFYDYFSQNGMSPAYVQKVLRITNQWGDFQAHRYQAYFKPIPAPTGREKSRIADKFFDKTPQGMKSKAMTPSMLESRQSELPEGVYNWLLVSLWFGLRPSEVSLLGNTDSKDWETVTVDGVNVLRIYQSKLMSVPRAERWKFIPCYEQEQQEALLLLLEKRPLEMPGRKLLLSNFGENVRLYAGRKGFMDLMLGRGHSLEDISTWMGHTTIERTWRDYKNRLSLKIKKPIPVS